MEKIMASKISGFQIKPKQNPEVPFISTGEYRYYDSADFKDFEKMIRLANLAKDFNNALCAIEKAIEEGLIEDVEIEHSIQ